MELPYFLRRESFRLAKSFATADMLQSLGHLTKILGGPHDPPNSTSLCSHLVYAFMLARLSLSYWTPSANPVKQDVFLSQDFSLWSCELYCICCFFHTAFNIDCTTSELHRFVCCTESERCRCHYTDRRIMRKKWEKYAQGFLQIRPMHAHRFCIISFYIL